MGGLSVTNGNRASEPQRASSAEQHRAARSCCARTKSFGSGWKRRPGDPPKTRNFSSAGWARICTMAPPNCWRLPCSSSICSPQAREMRGRTRHDPKCAPRCHVGDPRYLAGSRSARDREAGARASPSSSLRQSTNAAPRPACLANCPASPSGFHTRPNSASADSFEEGLSNAFKHAGGAGQRVSASWTHTMVVVEVGRRRAWPGSGAQGKKAAGSRIDRCPQQAGEPWRQPGDRQRSRRGDAVDGLLARQ